MVALCKMKEIEVARLYLDGNHFLFPDFFARKRDKNHNHSKEVSRSGKSFVAELIRLYEICAL